MKWQVIHDYIEEHKEDLIGLLQECIRARPVNPLYAGDHGYNEAACEEILMSRLETVSYTHLRAHETDS